MRRGHRSKWPTLVVFCLLFVGLQTLGVTYARWTGALQIGQTLTTGALALRPPEEGVRVFLVDSAGEPVDASPSVAAKLAEDGETLLLTIDGAFAAAALAEYGLLKLEVPLRQGDGSTVARVERTRADLTVQSGEVLEFTSSAPELVVGETVLFAEDLPSGTLDRFAVPLAAEIYRQVEARPNGEPIAAAYLWLTRDSRDALAVPVAIDTLAFDAADPRSGPLLAVAEGAAELEAQVRVRYTCALSLYVEQGNENSLPLPGEEERP